MKLIALLCIGLVLFSFGCTETTEDIQPVEPVTDLSCGNDYDCIGKVAPLALECGEGMVAGPVCNNSMECRWACSALD